MPRDPDLPPHDQLDGPDDNLDWDRSKLGPMAEAVAAHEGEPLPLIEDYDPARDGFLREG